MAEVPTYKIACAPAYGIDNIWTVDPAYNGFYSGKKHFSEVIWKIIPIEKRALFRVPYKYSQKPIVQRNTSSLNSKRWYNIYNIEFERITKEFNCPTQNAYCIMVNVRNVTSLTVFKNGFVIPTDPTEEKSKSSKLDIETQKTRFQSLLRIIMTVMHDRSRIALTQELRTIGKGDLLPQPVSSDSRSSVKVPPPPSDGVRADEMGKPVVEENQKEQLSATKPKTILDARLNDVASSNGVRADEPSTSVVMGEPVVEEDEMRDMPHKIDDLSKSVSKTQSQLAELKKLVERLVAFSIPDMHTDNNGAPAAAIV